MAKRQGHVLSSVVLEKAGLLRTSYRTKPRHGRLKIVRNSWAGLQVNGQPVGNWAKQIGCWRCGRLVRRSRHQIPIAMILIVMRIRIPSPYLIRSPSTLITKCGGGGILLSPASVRRKFPAASTASHTVSVTVGREQDPVRIAVNKAPPPYHGCPQIAPTSY